MQVQILQMIEGAKKATGLTVIIDVFRAFSLECYLFDRGVQDVAVGEGQHVLEKPDGELVGEERFDTFWDVERHKFEDL